MKITKKCPFTGKINTMDIPLTEAEFLRIELRNELIQNIVPHLSADHREFLISGITPDEWNKTFNSDEDFDV